MSGADVRTVAELLRDRTLAMVMRYAHLASEHKLEALRRMEKNSTLEATTQLTREQTPVRIG